MDNLKLQTKLQEMNDTFPSIGNATGFAGWEIRVGLCRFPATGRGARLTTNLWSIKKMTDASGSVCPLSPGVSVYSCLWMICPWWLFEAGSVFIWLQMKSFLSDTSRAETPVSLSVITPPPPTNERGWEAMPEFIFVSGISSFVTVHGQRADTFTLGRWSPFMPPV